MHTVCKEIVNIAIQNWRMKQRKYKSAADMHHTTSRNIFDTKTMHNSRTITLMKT